MKDSSDDWATPSEAAGYLKTTPGTLAQLRYRGIGPAYSKAPGGRVLYEWVDLTRWLQEYKKTSTATKVKPGDPVPTRKAC